MAAAIAKREARRRKILESSESRLRKIIGRDDWTESSSDNAKKRAGENDAKAQFELNDFTTNSLTTENAAYTHIKAFNSPNDYGFTNNKLISDKFENCNESSECFTPETIVNPCNSEQKMPMLFNKIIQNRLNYIVLAAVVNVLLICDMGYLFGQIVTVPYFLMTVGRLCVYKNLRETQNGNLLFAALILCNIKPELSLRLKTAVTLCTIFLRDLALYIFSFTLMHSVLSFYLHTYQDSLVSQNHLKHVEL